MQVNLLRMELIQCNLMQTQNVTDESFSNEADSFMSRSDFIHSTYSLRILKISAKAAYYTSLIEGVALIVLRAVKMLS